jgi:uncharacterized membrane protein YhaH (DUF805 family)
MNAVRFLFLSTGRINRAKFWLGLLIAKIILIGFLILSAVFATQKLMAVAVLVAGVAIYAWLLTAISAKRLHDMDVRAWWFAAMVGGPVIISAAGEAAQMQPLNALAGLISLGMLIILGAVEGTQGPNRFGPDPLEAKRRRTEAPVAA